MTNNGFNEADHKRVEDGTFTTKGQSVPEVQVRPGIPTYVAPDVPALRKRVQYRSQLITWGKMLESINAVSVERVLAGAANKPTWYAVHGGDSDVVVKIPSSVARASRLPDSTDPVERLNDDLVLLSTRREKLIDPAFGPRNEADLADLRSKVTSLIAERDALVRERELPEVADLSAMEKIHLIDGPTLSKAKAQLFADDDQLYVVRAVAGSKHRNTGGASYQEKLLFHPDETVRSNFIRGNDSLMDDALFQVTERDESQWARDAAAAELDRRGVTVTRVSPSEIVWGTKTPSRT
jgi:hypothetical protein